RSTKAGHYPRIDALAGVNSRGQVLNSDLDDFQVHNWNVGVIVHVPVFQGMRVVQQTSALQAELRALDASQEAVRQAILLDVKQALAQLRSAEEAVRASSK